MEVFRVNGILAKNPEGVTESIQSPLKRIEKFTKKKTQSLHVSCCNTVFLTFSSSSSSFAPLPNWVTRKSNMHSLFRTTIVVMLKSVQHWKSFLTCFRLDCEIDVNRMLTRLGIDVWITFRRTFDFISTSSFDQIKPKQETKLNSSTKFNSSHYIVTPNTEHIRLRNRKPFRQLFFFTLSLTHSYPYFYLASFNGLKEKNTDIFRDL